LELHGEGFFEVEPGSTFEVSTPAGDVYVVGTKFSVWANGSSLLVHCAEGRVVVDLDDGEIVLNAGEFTRRKSAGSLSPKQVYATEGPLFPSAPGEIDFENVPLGLVLAQIEDASNITIFSSLDEGLLYTGTLNLNRTKECLELVCKPFGAKFETNAEGYVTITP
jgi:ferric-dicitrate binding protein FerR (iron transport regulator)